MGGIIPVILCGGEGRRLWPLSTPEKPKPFHSFGRARSLFAEALLRCEAALFDGCPVIVAAARHEALVRGELAGRAQPVELALEPCIRNTCAASLAGALLAMARDPEALILVLAADQLIAPLDGFHAAIAEARSAAELGYIVTFGIAPAHPSPDFGYIVPGEALAGGSCRAVRCFKEKPGAAHAMALMAEGALWNSGNLLVRASLLCDLAKSLAPQVWTAVRGAVARATRAGDRVMLNETDFAAAASLALDVALLERSGNVAVLPLALEWRDLGNWASVADSMAVQT